MGKTQNIDKTKFFKDLPNIGNAIANHLHHLGIHFPRHLDASKPFDLDRTICGKVGIPHNSWMQNTYGSTVDFSRVGAPNPRWEDVTLRKAKN